MLYNPYFFNRWVRILGTMKKSICTAIATLALAFCVLGVFASEPLTNGEELIGKIHSRYSSDWYSHITFKQDMYRYKNDSLVRNEVWMVAYSSPSRLHIRYKDFSSGRGWFVVNDTLFTFNHNKLIGTRPRLHEVMILGYDMYSVNPSIVIPKVVGLGIDLSRVRVTTIKGKEYYEVGNNNVKCFWVGKDDLLFHGIRKVDENGVTEIFYQNYKMIYDKPVATEVQYFENGQMYLYEKYFDIRLPSSLPDDFFDPNLFSETRW